ncbi:unnamed protein product [Dibothriocephalus latus]|uniref:Uncharacterized protein n=1 Tax=Dibothriocephalus latus TaxID=60516 RepID=A0A3P7QDW2_DIBLA|nr:unnamed protein product [Dibothriocephalus latus]
MGLVTVYGLRHWSRVNVCEELDSDRRQWAAAIRDIREADSSNNRSELDQVQVSMRSTMPAVFEICSRYGNTTRTTLAVP